MLNWIEQRTGFVSMTKEFLMEDVPGGARYWYVFGSATLFTMMVQIVTGIFLTFFYAPSAATAWESTRAIYLNPSTHFLLAVHYWGASAMIALVFLHLLQVLIWGAYKSPRELQWVVGVLLLLVTLVLGLTGYLLPWDMDAYFASQVSLNITDYAATPLYRVVELVRALAAQRGIEVLGCELIGCLPLAAVETTAAYYLGVTTL